MRLSLVLPILALFFVACEPEVGQPCHPEPSFVDGLFTIENDDSQMQKNVNFTNCSQALCLSFEGSRPYCTIACGNDAACPTGFKCISPILTGELGCIDYAANGNSCQDSENFRSYCAAPASTIEARDREFGRK